MIPYTMSTFYLEAVDRNGQKVKKEVEAPNAEAVRNIVRSDNLIPIRIRPLKREAWNPLEKVSTNDLLIFTHELQSLLSSGMPLDRALYILSEHSDKPRLKKILRQIYSDIQKGNSLSQAMSRHKVFPNLYINMVKAGEEGGILEPVLTRIVSFLETTTTFKAEILSSLIYPILLTVIGGVTIAVLMLYVIPKFAAIFEDMGQALPLPTQFLLETSRIFISYWWLLAIAVAGAGVFFRGYARTRDGQIFIDSMKLKIPIIKKLHIRLAIARFSRTIGTLLKSGVPILSAIRISKEVIGNRVISDKLTVLQEGVSKGKGIYNPLREIGIFPPVVAQMIAVGEEGGTLEDTFLLIAERFETDSRNMIRRLISFMEPALILVMGVVVGFIVLSMLMAIFGIYEIAI
jgi:general secretion pathway protein F